MASAAAGIAVGTLVGTTLTLTGITSPATTAQAADSSAVTVAANQQDPELDSAPMPDLRVTVSQTRDLLAQGITISWTGGKKSVVPSGQTGGADFLQIMQCWGDDPDHPDQPDRTTCQYGGFNTPGASRDNTVSDGAVAEQDEQYTAPGTDFANPTYTSIPFKSATGEVVASVVDNKKVPVDVNTNQFFTRLTSNEVSWAGSGSNGEGSTKFEVQTATQSPGLGCGAPINNVDGTTSGKSCWLVIIPRGTADTGEQNIVHSGLFYDSWKHKLAVRIDFKPIGVRCQIGAAERQLAGSELVSDAVASWQPTLCGATDGAAYTAITGAESDAALAANGTQVAPMALTSRALTSTLPGDETSTVTDKLSYAPIALTGLSIGFAIDREVDAFSDPPQDVADRARLPFTSLKLTPRLVAKLLTYSYVDSLPTYADKSHINVIDADHPGKNARNLTYDPEFLAINDKEWAYQAITSPALADLLEPQGRSDAAWALWNYVMSDEDARSFLAGEADPWGMIVNPWFSIDADTNPTGTALALPRDDFPKADPIEQPAAADGPAAVNLVTWRPYSNSLDTSGYLALRGDGQILGAWDAFAIPPKYTKASRSLPGLQRVLAITDTAAAAKYQVYSAELLNPAGEFVGPTTESLTEAAAAMTVDPDQTQVYGFDPTSGAAKGAKGAYPLAMPVYAAVNPAMSDADARTDYASFIAYAATSGQESGTGIGQLPEGYAPIPDGWRDQAITAARTIAAGPAQPVAPTATPAPRPTSSAPAKTAPQAAPAAGAAPSAPLAASDPNATGTAAASLIGAATPADAKLDAISVAVPLSIIAGLAAAIAVSILTRVRRRL